MTSMFPMLMLIQEEAAKAGEEAAKGGLLSPQGGLMVWTLIIFLVLFVVLSKYAFKPIPGARATGMLIRKPNMMELNPAMAAVAVMSDR